MKNLVIVESPAKAKTIEGYLGQDFVVKSSFGHVRDLPEKGLGIDVKNKFKPQYEVSSDKTQTIKELKKLSDEAETVWLASDDDREGEAIAWHLKESLDLNDVKTRRIVFREITKKAISNAIQNPRGIDLDLVNAQQARRVLDRLVGYELSPVLWKKIKTGLSAGRVQSVAVRLVVDREREIENHKSKASFLIRALFNLEGNKKLMAELPKRFNTEEEAFAFLQICNGAKFSISNIEVKQGKRSPAPPFTTSTLQQEASRKLSFSVSRTMLIAQKLYENGKITYMRTDSFNLSEDAISNAADVVNKSYGQKYVQSRRYKTKSEGAQEAHEAIRPTNFGEPSAGTDNDEKRLYDLIWKRAIASQMSDAEIEKTVATIAISTTPENLIATGEVVKFDGFLKVYSESNDEDDEEGGSKMLPPLSVGQNLEFNSMTGNQIFSKPSARYTEASLVKKLEEMGIGRPSTYAPTITTVQKRNYVIKENRDGKEREAINLTLKNSKIERTVKKEVFGAEKMKLFPTDLAMVVNDFLVQNFQEVIDFQFTAKVEKEFDDIAEGKMDWIHMLEHFYTDFHKTVETSENISRKEVGAARLIGVDPKSGLNMYAKLGKFGPFVQIGESEADSGVKPKYAKLRQGQLLETLTQEEALELFKLPRSAGEFETLEMVINVGRFGPYILHDKKFYSLAKTDDPYEVTEDRAIQIIEEKRKAELEKTIKEFDENPDVKVLKGRYGPYIVVGKKNVKIPKGKEPESLTLAECLELGVNTPDAPAKGKRFFKKK